MSWLLGPGATQSGGGTEEEHGAIHLPVLSSIHQTKKAQGWGTELQGQAGSEVWGWGTPCMPTSVLVQPPSGM